MMTTNFKNQPGSDTQQNRPQEAVDDFAARFGREARAYLDLARHAALPLALTPDLLYLIWFNFRSDEQGQPLQIPWVAVADLLLSNLCHEISHETYALENGVRRLLQQQMLDDARFGLARIQRLALFLDQYAERQLHSDNPYTQEAGQAQRLVAYAYANPQQLVDYLAQVYQRLLSRPQMIRYATLMETLQDPVANWPHVTAATQQTFKQAQAVGRGLAQWARGDVETAVSHLHEHFPSGIAIGGAPVALPHDVQQALAERPLAPEEGSETVVATADDVLAFFNDYVDRMMFDVSSRLEAALRAIGAWQQDSSRPQIMVITGQPATGKTNLAVNFVKQVRQGSTTFGLAPPAVGAYHFCMADRPETLDARLFVQSLQQQLAARFPDFRDALPDDPAGDPNVSWEPWLEQQLIDPLRPLLDIPVGAETMTTGRPQELLIMIDDVDAATGHSSPERILDVCLRLLEALPGLRLLLMTGMSTAVRDALEGRDYTYFTLDTVYRNVDLRIGDAATKQPAREVEVLASPAGVSPSPFVITYDDDLVPRVNRELGTVTPETPRRPLGADLFRTFIAGETWELLRASMDQVRQVGERLRLRFFLADADYISLPWEWLYEEGVGFWVQQPDVSLVRYRGQTAVFRTRANPQPINVLFASAMPKSGPPFPAGEMAAQLQQSLAGQTGRVAFTTMQNTSWPQLHAAVTDAAVHVLHLAAAVEHENGQALLLLENEGRPVPLPARELAAVAQENALALVVLSAVWEDQWTAVLHAADELVAAGLPAVMVLPARLPDSVMAQGVATLIDQLADGAWLDTATAAARQALAELREGEAAAVDLALFTSMPHGNIWRSEITAVDLYEALAGGFTLAELQALCLAVQVDYDSLAGDGRRGKMVSLVRQMQQQDRLQALALALLDAQPGTNFAYRRRETTDEMAVPPALLDQNSLGRLLNENYNLEEIRVLCLELGVDFEALPGETKQEKVRALIDLLGRQQRWPSLAVVVLRERPALREQFRTGRDEVTADPVEIYRILAERFSLADLYSMMSVLDVNAEDLPGEKKEAKARELVLWMQRHGRLPELLQAMQRHMGLPATGETVGTIDVDSAKGTVSIGGVELPVEDRSASAPPMPPPTKGLEGESAAGTERPSAQTLRRALVDNFDTDELRTVSFELHIDYENLTGESKSALSHSLVQQAQQEGRLMDLAQLIQRVRPDVDWGGLGEND